MSNTFKIEKGIPFPGARVTSAPNLSETLRAMNVGDSALIPGRSPKNIYSQANVVAKLAADGRKYAVRTTPEGQRVWRIA